MSDTGSGYFGDVSSITDNRILLSEVAELPSLTNPRFTVEENRLCKGDAVLRSQGAGDGSRSLAFLARFFPYIRSHLGQLACPAFLHGQHRTTKHLNENQACLSQVTPVLTLASFIPDLTCRGPESIWFETLRP